MTRIHLMLLAAIVIEVIATTALARSAGMTRPMPSAVALVGYGLAFWLLAQALQTMPTGVVYAIWSGVGIVLIASVAWLWGGQRLDVPAMLGMGLIVAGVMVVNLFSGTMGR